ncbi:MAG: hypothetical protein ACRCU2_30350 [Planktothrix sp.]
MVAVDRSPQRTTNPNALKLQSGFIPDEEDGPFRWGEQVSQYQDLPPA